MEYRQVQRRTAKKLYNDGKILYIVPCNFNPISYGIYTIQGQESEFEINVSIFEYNNCNKRMGRYAHFYIKLD